MLHSAVLLYSYKLYLSVLSASVLLLVACLMHGPLGRVCHGSSVSMVLLLLGYLERQSSSVRLQANFRQKSAENATKQTIFTQMHRKKFMGRVCALPRR